jgi:carbonic anhydrase
MDSRPNQRNYPFWKQKNSDIQRLMLRYRTFQEHYFCKAETLDRRHFQKLVEEGQRPKIMLISCCDSRVDPSAMFQCPPGTLFVVRNVANLIPPCEQNPRCHSTSAALEFAVNDLLVEHIIVLGHSQCGGIKALLNTPSDLAKEKRPDSFIDKWMEIAAPAKQKTLREHKNDSFQKQARYCEEESLRISLKNLCTFPWIQEKVTANKLFLHAWRVDLVTGNIQQLTSDNKFENIIPEEQIETFKADPYRCIKSHL